jgi:hypothetical protein
MLDQATAGSPPTRTAGAPAGPITRRKDAAGVVAAVAEAAVATATAGEARGMRYRQPNHMLHTLPTSRGAAKAGAAERGASGGAPPTAIPSLLARDVFKGAFCRPAPLFHRRASARLSTSVAEHSGRAREHLRTCPPPVRAGGDPGKPSRTEPRVRIRG